LSVRGANDNGGAAEPVAIDRLKAALATVAFGVVHFGDAYIPILERLEREIELAENDNSPRRRAERVLAMCESATMQ
jgi:hypothetical protein